MVGGRAGATQNIIDSSFFACRPYADRRRFRFLHFSMFAWKGAAQYTERLAVMVSVGLEAAGGGGVAVGGGAGAVRKQPEKPPRTKPKKTPSPRTK